MLNEFLDGKTHSTETKTIFTKVVWRRWHIP